MAWPWLAILARNIPWVELARRAPDILESSRRLLDKSRGLEAHGEQSTAPGTPPSVEQLRERVAALEAREVEQAQVVAQIAEQLEGLTDVVKVLGARNRLLRYVVGVLVIAVAALAIAVVR